MKITYKSKYPGLQIYNQNFLEGNKIIFAKQLSVLYNLEYIQFSSLYYNTGVIKITAYVVNAQTEVPL